MRIAKLPGGESQRPHFHAAHGKSLVGVVIAVHSDADLMQIVRAAHAPGGFPRRLHGRQKQRNEQPDDGNHDQQLDQRKTRRGAKRECGTPTNRLRLGNMETPDPRDGNQSSRKIITGNNKHSDNAFPFLKSDKLAASVPRGGSDVSRW